MGTKSASSGLVFCFFFNMSTRSNRKAGPSPPRPLLSTGHREWNPGHVLLPTSGWRCDSEQLRIPGEVTGHIKGIRSLRGSPSTPKVLF